MSALLACPVQIRAHHHIDVWTDINKCYSHSFIRLTYHAAEIVCNTGKNGHLVTVNNENIQKFISEYVAGISKLQKVYIGLSSFNNMNEFKWTSGDLN